MMKKRTYLLMMTAATLLLAGLSISCSKKETKPTRMVVAKPAPAEPVGTQRLDERQAEEMFEWMGRTYRLSVSRKADESLPTVDDGAGVKYYDNRITVDVTREDGSSFYSRTFTKDNFASYLTGQASNRALIAISMHTVTPQALSLVVCIGSPDESSDDYQTLELRITPDGNSSVREITILEKEEA